MIRVGIIGLGNNGSHVAPLVARSLATMPASAELVLIDHDTYEARNLGTQAIERSDIGRNKAKAQARRLRRLHPSLRIVAHACRFEELPLGELKLDAVLTCLDSRAARVAVNQRLWSLGVPYWADAGVSPDEGLVRLTVFRPDLQDQPCFECEFTDQDYTNLEVTHPCMEMSTRATGASAALGALAASLHANECEKMLRGDWDQIAAGKEIIISAKWHTHFLTSLKRRATCRFNHHRLSLDTVENVEPEKISLGDFLTQFAPTDDFSLRVEGTVWLTSLICSSCRKTQDALVLRGRGLAEAALCRECNGRLHPSGFHTRADLPRDEFSSARLALPLNALGIRSGEIMTFIRKDDNTQPSLLLSHAC